MTLLEYHAMLDDGALFSGDRIELIDGALLPKGVKSAPHRIASPPGPPGELWKR